MLDPFIGEIAAFGFNYNPKDWEKCNGQNLSISDHTALYSLLGTTYGGDGRTFFSLPNLEGRTPIHQGYGPGLTPKPIGQYGGAEFSTLSVDQLPSHTHSISGEDSPSGVFEGTPDATAMVKCNNTESNTIEPSGKVWGKNSGRDTIYADNVVGSDIMHPDCVDVELDMNPVSVKTGVLAESITIGHTGSNNGHYNMQPYLVINYCISLNGMFPPRP